ncbi:MAG: NAD-dependent epimerase/dehydratase family protein [Candidatus Hermodarchaeota archaeon]
MKNILITGGTGFIGSHLVKRLNSMGHKLKLLVRETSDLSPFEGLSNIEYFYGDVRDSKSLYQAADGVDLIFHLVAYVKIWAKDPSIFDDINIGGAENIAKVALEKDKKLIYISSFMAIGFNPIDNKEPLDETHEHNEDFFNSDYERTKYYGKKKIEEYIQKGLKAILISPGFVYGPGDFNIYGQMLIDICSENFMGLPGKGNALFCMAYINDVIDGLIKVMDRDDIIGEHFILGGENVAVGDYLDLIAEIADVKKPRHVPMALGWAFAKACEAKAKINKKMPEIVWPMLRGMKYNWAYSSQKAINTLDYKITPLKKALKDTIDWYQDYLEKEKNKK